MESFARITGEAVCSCIEAEGTKYVPGGCVLMKTHHQVQLHNTVTIGFIIYVTPDDMTMA